MRKVLASALLLLLTTALAQTPSAQAVVPVPAPKHWGSLGATARFPGTGLSLAYGQQDLLAPGTDARFGARYFSDLTYDYLTGLPGFGLELRADALAYTYDPDPERSLALVAYGGLGPRFLVLAGITDYSYYDYNDPNAIPSSVNAYLINIGGLGGLEARLGRFGLFLEVDLSLPILGLVGPRFRAMPFDVGTALGLTIGSNYYF